MIILLTNLHRVRARRRRVHTTLRYSSVHDAHIAHIAIDLVLLRGVKTIRRSPRGSDQTWQSVHTTMCDQPIVTARHSLESRSAACRRSMGRRDGGRRPVIADHGRSLGCWQIKASWTPCVAISSVMASSRAQRRYPDRPDALHAKRR